jgi:hypothetical protein
MARTRHVLALAASASALIVVLGCGPEAPPTARTRPMAPGAPTEPAAEPFVDVPSVTALRFEPAAPVAGRSARAIAKTSEDVPGLRLEYVWRLGGRGAPARRDGIDLTDARPGERLQLTVTPYVGDEAGIPVSHAVRLRGPAPRVLGVSFEPARGLTADARVEARPILEDVDPHRTTEHFQWIVNGRRQSAYESSFDTKGLRRGDRLEVEVTVTSAGESSAPFLSEPIVLENAAPRLDPAPIETDESGGVHARLGAVDPDGDAPIRFELVEGPDGLSLSQDGRLSWPAEQVVAGRHAVAVALTDARGASRTSRFSLDVGTPAAPAP